MTPEIAKKLLPLVNVKRNLDALEMYMESRITAMHRSMEQGDDMKAVYQAQGAIQEYTTPVASMGALWTS